MTTIHKLSAIQLISCLGLLVACGPNDTQHGAVATLDLPTGGTSAQATTGTASMGGASSPTLTEIIPANLRQSLSAARQLDGATLQQTYPAPVNAALNYDATTAIGMDLIQGSSLALSAGELSALGQNGLVISKGLTFPSFAYGYKSIYFEDLPVYVSADSILEAVHRTFDSLLKQTESIAIIGQLTDMLSGMRARLAASGLDASTAQDVDLYLTLAASLLQGQLLTPVISANASDISSLYNLAKAASGHQTVSLFGVQRDEDFSQFEPRGHYTDSEALGRYFKAMMWLGRVDLRLIETQGDGTQVFHRRQFDAAVALRQLMGDTEFGLWTQIDRTIGAYVGEHDSMTPKDMDGLMNALHVTSTSDASSVTDQQIIDEIVRGGWGAQRIASRIIIIDARNAEALPLDRSFTIFGQRYTVDSNVFVNVTHDRVTNRLMPNPLDVAFAALGNDSALPLLSSEFGNLSYVQGLAQVRTLVDAHEPAYWEGSVYTRWLGALRTLSPKAEAVLLGITNTVAWQNRMLSSQLASWAELRHDTILYAKQSYTGGVSCEFPDAYVDPYPEFYAKLGELADAVGVVVQDLPASAESLKTTTRNWVANFKLVASNLQKMAEDQVTGTSHSTELIAFINDAVKWDEQSMCGGVTRSNLSGWYLKLYLSENAGLEYDPTVADVHTQPTDAAGNDVGRILHVGTGTPRLMVVTVETCQGPRAYAGLAFAYGERITDGWKRLNDQQWMQDLSQGFPDVPWVSSLLAQ